MIAKRPPKITSYSQINRVNFLRHAGETWRGKNYIDPKTHFIKAETQVLYDIPWDFVNNDWKRHRYCKHAQDFFRMYQMVPPFCVSCYKIVVRPRKHSELVKLSDLMYEMAEKDPECWCKCGTEHRMYVPGIYGGYFYTDDRETWRKRYEQARQNVDSKISPDVPIVMKRYCTEFEKELGDSIDTEKRQPEDAEELQRFYFSHLDINQEGLLYQPKLVKINVYQGWLEFGWKFGTPEDRKEIEDTYNDGKPLHRLPRTYEGTE